MIKSLVVKGLWGRYDYDLQFNEDVNIFTGSNGTGKTTLLKLLWYVYSGHYKQLIEEIYFDEVVITAAKKNNTFIIKRERTNQANQKKQDSNSFQEHVSITRLYEDEKYTFDSEIINNQVEKNPDSENYNRVNSSLFFPTFRRLEGGFSLHENIDLVNVLRDFTTKMTRGKHRFICSSNSEDIRALVNEISSDIRIKMEVINQEFMNFISHNINGNASQGFTEELKNRIEIKESNEMEAKAPIDTLSNIIDWRFWGKSIKITDDLKLGNHENELNIENLSAGEKNFLSFFVYATSIKEGVIFIDEPELNLHIDWQRDLVALLRNIAPNVQLFLATHSPAIYAGYPDKAPWFDELVKTSKTGEPVLVSF